MFALSNPNNATAICGHGPKRVKLPMVSGWDGYDMFFPLFITAVLAGCGHVITHVWRRVRKSSCPQVCYAVLCNNSMASPFSEEAHVNFHLPRLIDIMTMLGGKCGGETGKRKKPEIVKTVGFILFYKYALKQWWKICTVLKMKFIFARIKKDLFEYLPE